MNASGVRTRIVATVGPSMLTVDAISAAIDAGVSGFRIPLARQPNRAIDLSHMVSRIAADMASEIAIYLDVPGPKKILVIQDEVPEALSGSLRVPVVGRSAFQGLSVGGMYLLSDSPQGYFDVGDTILLGDGETSLLVEDVSDQWLVLRPPVEGLEVGQFGVAVAGKEGHPAGAPLLNEASAALVAQIPQAKLMLSFVESPEQIRETRAVLAGAGVGQPELWAKVETCAGVENLESVISTADGVLLGRGDLLIDAGPLDYYRYERRVRDVLLGGQVPLMVGTQLWTASSRTSLPHRSELSYVCEWISAGVESLLLSDETTVGRDPIRVIESLNSLIEQYSRVD